MAGNKPIPNQSLENVIASFRTRARHEKELSHNQDLFKYQVGSMIVLAVMSIFVGFVEWIWPDFFNYPYFLTPSLSAITSYWPMFIYAGAMATLSGYQLQSSKLDESLLGWGMVTSVFAGIWEELGFRWIFICTGMIGLVISNFIWSTFLGFIFGGIMIILGIVVLIGKDTILEKGSGLLVAVLGAWVFYVCFKTDPVYWVYDNIVVFIINAVTLGFFSDILRNPDIPSLFIFGMVVANAKFRDGHKYQGLIGFVNSWIVGFVMMGAMLNHGIWVAIIIHALYDIEFDLVRYGFRKLKA